MSSCKKIFHGRRTPESSNSFASIFKECVFAIKVHFFFQNQIFSFFSCLGRVPKIIKRKRDLWRWRAEDFEEFLREKRSDGEICRLCRLKISFLEFRKNNRQSEKVFVTFLKVNWPKKGLKLISVLLFYVLKFLTLAWQITNKLVNKFLS